MNAGSTDREENEQESEWGSDYETDGSESDCYLSEMEPTHDYVQEATNILTEKSTVTTEHALAINQAMHSKLLKMREALEDLLHKCEQKYTRNRQLLESSVEKQTHKLCYRLCGAPFFKDLDMFPAPPNDDYRRRSKKNGELFLMDLRAIRHRYWTILDKQNLVQAVKSQVLDYLNPEKKAKDRSDIRATEKNIELHTTRLATLLQKAGQNFRIDWELVSEQGLSGRHSSNTCYAMWNGYMRPDINRGSWTPEENDRLTSMAEKFNFQTWDLISSEMPGRSENQCFVQFQNTVNSHLPSNRRWTPHEDQLILKAVSAQTKGRSINWTNVCGYFINRTKTAIYTRYKNVLNPSIKKGSFSREEDCVLMAAIEEYGENFACIPMSLFPNRSRNQVKSRWQNTIKYQKLKRGWTVKDDEILIEYVKANGKGKWSEISKMLKVHPRGSCRTRYNVIEKFFQKNPNAAIKDIPRKNRGISTDVCIDNWMDKIYELKTIGDVKEQEREDRRKKCKAMMMRRADTYRGMLKPHARKLYESFKYSYDYDYMNVIEPPSFLTGTLPFYYVTLNCNITAENLDASRKSFEIEEIGVLENVLGQSNKDEECTRSKTRIPINWSTVLGMRALTILANNDTYRSAVKNHTLKTSANTAAEKLFRERFMKMFSKTSQLTKISPDIIASAKYAFQYCFEKSNNQLPTKSCKVSNNTEETISFFSHPKTNAKRRKL